MDPSILGSMHLGSFRLGVYNDTWGRVLNKMKEGRGSLEATYRLLVLGGRDATTGWRDQSYTDFTIETIILPQGSTFSFQGVGVFAREDAMGVTQDPVHVYGQIKTLAEKYYQIKTVKEYYDRGSFAFREAQLSELPLYEE